jgi:phenylpropionate dioxygenase-like ring-hydroxylating dioxygenase large terminal subunit
MIKEEEIRVLRQLQSGIDNGTTDDAGGIVKVPVSDFTSEELLAREQPVFFKEKPILFGLSSDLPEPNSYVATNETGSPILMTRDGEGEFRAFFNVCRHRGTQVVPEGRGTRDRFSCPFHAWTYRNSGELLAITHEESFGCIDKGRQGLVELAAVEKYGMLWVRPSPGESFDVDEILGGLASDMESLDLPGHKYEEQQVLKANINWKLAIDTYGEGYHFSTLHKDTIGPDFYSNLQASDAFGLNYRWVVGNKTGFKYVHDSKLPVEEWPFHWITTTIYFFFPNIILLREPEGFDLVRIYPDENSPGKSRSHFSFYRGKQDMLEHFGGSVPEESHYEGFNRVVRDEDYWAAASSQLGAESGAQTHVTFGRNEPALHHYHNAHRRGLGLPLLELQEA